MHQIDLMQRVWATAILEDFCHPHLKLDQVFHLIFSVQEVDIFHILEIVSKW